MNLTKRQKEILNFIKEYIRDNNYPPSIREIACGLGLSSPATIHSHLNNLEMKNIIKKSNNKFRSIELLVENEFLNTDENTINVPLLGKVTAGTPIEAIENPGEFFQLPAYLVPKNKEVFTLKVDGYSMINKNITDNDIVIVERTKTCNNRDIVVAMTDDNEVTLKTFYKEKDHIRLQPENDEMEPIILKNVTILGKVVGLYRKI